VQAAEGTIKVGVLHSLSGTMAISETVLKDVTLMAIDEINASGGVLGKKLEAVVVDPASNWPLFAEKARQADLAGQGRRRVRLLDQRVAQVGAAGVRGAERPLFYPVQYEGEELSKNVFYTGAAPNQQAIPAVEYLMSKEGGGAKRWVLLGTDYVYPRTTNKILRAFLKSKGVTDKDIDEKYTPFGHSDYQTIVPTSRSSRPAARRGRLDDQRRLERAVLQGARQPGLKATDVPVVAFSVGEEELRGVDTNPLVGHLAAWNYFMTLKNPANDSFKKQWAAYAKAKKLPAPTSRSPTIRWKRPTSASTCGSRPSRRPSRRTPTRSSSAMAGQTFAAPDGFDDQDGREEPPSVEARVHRRSPEGRPVQRRLEDQGPDPRATVEPVHRRQPDQEGYGGPEEEIAAAFSCGLAAAGPGDDQPGRRRSRLSCLQGVPDHETDLPVSRTTGASRSAILVFAARAPGACPPLALPPEAWCTISRIGENDEKVMAPSPRWVASATPRALPCCNRC
jgi:urea transport system substrate-binding protein